MIPIVRTTETRNACKILVEKREGRRPLERPNPRWGIILKTVLRNRMGGMDWIHLARNRNRWLALVNNAINLPLAKMQGILD
jgi:hypothetical protein